MGQGTPTVQATAPDPLPVAAVPLGMAPSPGHVTVVSDAQQWGVLGGDGRLYLRDLTTGAPVRDMPLCTPPAPCPLAIGYEPFVF